MIICSTNIDWNYFILWNSYNWIYLAKLYPTQFFLPCSLCLFMHILFMCVCTYVCLPEWPHVIPSLGVLFTFLSYIIYKFFFLVIEEGMIDKACIWKSEDNFLAFFLPFVHVSVGNIQLTRHGCQASFPK